MNFASQTQLDKKNLFRSISRQSLFDEDEKNHHFRIMMKKISISEL